MPYPLLNRRHFCLGITALSAVGCTTTVTRTVQAPSFEHLDLLNFNVASMSIESLHINSDNLPHIEGSSPYPLNRMVENWLNANARTVGSLGHLNIQIIDASLLEEKLKRSSGFNRLFTIDQTEAYNGSIQLFFQVQYPDHNGSISVESRASKSVDENVTLRDRQRTWVNIGQDMIDDIDQRLRIDIRKKLPRLFLAG